MAQVGFTRILIYASGIATNVPAAGNLTSSASGAELAINYADGKLYYKDSGGNVQLIASKSGASGDVVGPASATDNAIVRFDGTTGKLVQNSVVTIADSTGDISGVGVLNATTLDATNIEVTNIKAKDGTAAASIADSTGKITVSTELAVDNLNLSGNTLSSTDTNGNIVLAPNGTGDVQVDADTLRVGDSGAAATITTNGTGNLVLNTNAGTNSGSITIDQGSNGNIEVAPNGTGDVYLTADTVRIGDSNANATLTTNGAGDLILNTNSGTNSGSITIADGANGDMTLTPNGNGSVVITNAGTSNALRITQTGSGDALLVEDSANPDSTPVVIDSSGQLIVGHTSYIPTVSGLAGGIASVLTSSGQIGYTTNRFQDDATDAKFVFNKARGSVTTPTVVANNDGLGKLWFAGYDGAAYIRGAIISGEVDGTPGTNDMPGRLVFSTTADGASSPTERMRIDSEGQVGIGGTPATATTLDVVKNLTGGTNPIAVYARGVIQSDGTGDTSGFYSRIGTAAAAFTVGNLRHFRAFQGTFGATSSVNNQVGYFADASLTGAINNFGFYSNIASGTGRWNFYANGTASNYFGGNTIISVADNTNAALRITQTGTGDAILVEDSANPDSSPFVIDASGRAIIGDTASRTMNDSITGSLQLNSTGAIYASIARWSAASPTAACGLVIARSRGASIGTNAIVASGDTIGNIFFSASDGTNFIAAASITAAVDGTPGTNDMPGRLVFSTTADGASTPTERMRIDSSGAVGIGTTLTQVSLYNTRNISGNATSYGNYTQATIQSDVTNAAHGYRSNLSTAAASFNLGALYNFYAGLGTVGAGSTVANHYGFIADSTLTGATNNYGFFSNIASGTGRWNFYANGTAANYFAGDMQLDKTVTSTGTTGAQTINKNAGTVNFAAAATSLVVTDSRVTADSIIICTVGTNDTTMKSVAAVAGAGSFTLHANAAATAETRVNFLIIN